MLHPILIFHPPETFSGTADDDDDDESREPPFPTPYDEVEVFPAGLYLNPADREAADFEE